MYIIKKIILRNFFKIDLSGNEAELAYDSITKKYQPTVIEAIVIGIMIIPAVLFLDTNVLVSTLIPITMVTGTAWFAISLATMRKKFETFGLELTASLFKSFVSSLMILGLLTLFSLSNTLFTPLIALGQGNSIIETTASILGIMVVFRILWNVFVGSLQYDINDAMLAGQAEVAEKFFKKSLSLLHASAENLRRGKNLEVANYYLGLSFYDIFNYISDVKPNNKKIIKFITQANELKTNPQMSQEEADVIAIHLIKSFLMFCTNNAGKEAQRIYLKIKSELFVLNNKKEDQKIVDTRFSIIFDEIAELIDLQGDNLFK